MAGKKKDSPQDDVVEILGYSERGLLSSLLYEMAARTTAQNAPATLFGELLNYYQPMDGNSRKPRIGHPKSCQVLLEPSFSDFGDADAVFNLRTDSGENHCVFIEAKVSNGRFSWRLSEHYEWFLEHTGKSRSEQAPSFSSNLFSQMYHKYRLVGSLHDKDWQEKLQAGIEFPNSSTKQLRKIGHNVVVLRSAERIHTWLSKAATVWYLAVIPEIPEGPLPFDRLPADYGWDTSQCGYVSWRDVLNFCENRGLTRTLGVFQHNDGLIFERRLYSES